MASDMPPTIKKSKTLQSRIVSGSVILLSGSGVAIAINLGYNVALARFLGPKGFGHATAVYTLLTLVSAVTLSFQTMSAKAVARQSQSEFKDSVYRSFHQGAWICGMLTAFVLCVFQKGITNYLNLPSSLLVVLLAVGAAFYVPLGSRRGYIQGAYGFGRLASNLVLEGAVRLAASLLMIAFGFGVVGVIAANSAAIAIAYFAIAPPLSQRTASPLGLKYAFTETSQAVVFFVGQVLINNCDIVLVKHFFPSQEAGLYAAIAMVGRVVFAGSSSVVNSMFPLVAGSKDEERKSLSLISTSLLLVLAIGCVIALALRVMPSWVWTLCFGQGFQMPGPHGFPYLLALYAITTVIYSLSVVIITYEMSYRLANTRWLQLIFSGVLIASICRFHTSLQQVIMVQLVLMVILLLVVGLPFFAQALKTSNTIRTEGSQTIRLIRRISEDEVIAEFLRSDFEDTAYRKYHQTLRPIVFQPNMQDENESAMRRALLFLRHRSLWKELPMETEWFEAEVGQSNLGQIHVFPRAQWRKLARGNFVATDVIKRLGRMRPEEKIPKDPFLAKLATMRSNFSEGGSMPGSVVLIGLSEKGPLTILDGNHRLIAAALEGKVHTLRFVCGLSPKMIQCCWYRTNFVTLARYGTNLLRDVVQNPETDLESLSNET